MFPLILVGITLVSCTLGDVKHVLDGTVGGQHSSSVDPKEINRLAYSGSAKSPRDFWWMADDSPLKEAYDYYKKCSLKGNCANVGKSVAGSEIGKNPFLNGDFKNGKIPTGGAVKSAGFHSGATLDLSNNPFLNGNKQSAAGAPEGTTLCKGHGYICVENGLCKNGFVNHNGEGLLQIRSDVQFCQNNQVCCRLSSAGPAPQKINLNLPALDNNLNQVTAGKSSVPESAIKFGGLPGFSSGTIQILNDQNLEPQISVAGESGHHKGSSTIKPRDVSDSLFSASSSTPDYSNVDFGDVRFASTIQGPAYLPPDRPDNTNKITTYVPPPRPTCAPGQIQLPSGVCGYPSTPRPTCAPGQITLPSGGCGYPSSPRPTCAPGQITLPGGGCAYPTTPRPTCAPGQIQLPSGVCAYPTTPRPRPTCGPGQVLSPSGSCVYISTTPRPCGFGQIRNPQGVCEYVGSPSTTPAEYLPPRPPSTTQRPGYSYPTPTPSFTYPSPIIPDGNNVDNVYVPSPTTSTTTPRTGESIKDTNTPDHETSPGGNDEIRIPIPGQPRPVGPSGPSGPPPPSCAAALKCVQEIYCTADGFVSPVPVVLTKEQELLRVPTTECSNQESGTIGKCCRDPNYKDPWPSANLVDGFDDGQYKEDNHFGEVGNLQRIVRSQQGSVQRLVRSQKSPVNARSINSSPAVPQQLARSQEQCGTRNYNTKPQGQRPIDMNFAEIPWQAMILRDTNRSLLCGGAIIRSDAVLTAAHCVEGLETSDILIKGGEWKLGIDEEPLPFQIVKVAAIVRHPEYVHGALVNDLAVLVLEEKLRLAKNIGPICLPEPNQIPTQNCIATGWGKRILQLHAKNALMHGIDVKIMDTNQCKETLAEKFKDSVQNYSPNTLCGFSSIDQCRVDYGSALACDNGNGQYTLSGIYSWDTGCKQEGQIGGYIAPDVEWVRGCLNKPINELKRLDSEYTSKSRN
ncbi:unnamed protein product [Brassicogethes aeneus]|uniref:Peptidase S1 domain-containing protein n=1 Tax=Brassicogethes aeneus TaxID=1431903 RepID=A0A9P0AVK9_BRAAE|nr:unnamed protein product [Brassicogethes aeneus]